MDGYILSIDQGTSGSKAHIFDHSGGVVSNSYHETTQYRPRQGWVEQDPQEIWQVTMRAVEEALQGARILPEDILALGISNQRCTTVAWNRVTGEAIGRAIVWQDRRSWDICERFSPSERAEMERRNGIGVFPNLSAGKMRWLMDNDRNIQRTAAKGELLFGTMDSWLVWKLSGGAAHVTDLSNASATGLLNADSLRYDDWILEKYGVPPEALPALRGSSEIYAHTRPEAFFGVSIPISACVGDQPAAAFAQACHSPGAVKSSYGTGSFMIRSTGERHLAARNGIISPVLWSIGDSVSYGLEGFADVSGEVLHWLRDGLGIIHDAGEADGLALQVPDSGGVYFVPAFVGLAPPHQCQSARGTVFGLNFDTKKQHIARAALESMAYQTRDSLENIEGSYDFRAGSLRADGGGAKSDFLMQFQADILGFAVERPTIVEASSQGAAYLAGLAIGYWQSIEETAANWRLDTRFEPRITDSRREALYGGWLRAVEYAGQWGRDRSTRSRKGGPDRRLELLSPREREVLRLYASGKSVRDISSLLYTSVKTVEKQRHDGMKKLGVDNLASAVHACIDIGLIDERHN
jgi:glycerol kinase